MSTDPRDIRERFHAGRVLSSDRVDFEEPEYGKWLDFADLDEFEYKFEFWEMRFKEEGIAELYVEEVHLDEFERPLYVAYLEEVISEQRKAIGVDFNQTEAESLLQDYKKSHSSDEIKQEIQQLRGDLQ